MTKYNRYTSLITMLSFSLLMLLTSHLAFAADPLLSQGKAATQSSNYGSAVAGRAVDGNTDGTWSVGTTTHTGRNAQAWWQVDLGNNANLSEVKLWNRTDCCRTRLSNFYLLISATDMTGQTLAQLQADPAVYAQQVSSLNGQDSIALALSSVQGRYVRIQLAGTNNLSLAEVQVYGVPVVTTDPLLSQGKAATQSSNYGSAVAGRAVDGNTDGTWSVGTTTHTGRNAQAWWQVDLGNNANLSEVKLWNRTDCCRTRLSNFYLLISATDMTGQTLAQLQADPAVYAQQVSSLNGQDSIALALSSVQGRYVRIQLAGINNLSLAEVQVYGVPVVTTDPLLSQGKAASQSSNYGSAVAGRAVDGNTDGTWSVGTTTHTGRNAQAWWQVDLGNNANLSEVKLWNRTDCCRTRLSNFYLLISATDMTGQTLAQLQADPAVYAQQVSSLNGQDSISLALSSVQGRYVRIQLAGINNLSLAEVQVYGVVASGSAAQAYFIHTDHLNTPRLITDAANNNVWQWNNNDPFGNNIVNDDPNNTGSSFTYNPRFPGQYYDAETNLHYNYFRDYDPATGRYLQSDPIGLGGGINTYGYVGGNPMSYVDPYGLRCVYSQSSGSMICVSDQSGEVYYEETGYSGTGEGRDNPDAQDQESVGPIPDGAWDVGSTYDSRRTGRNTIILTPREGEYNSCPDTSRGCETFRIHGNNSRNDASRGCIILPPNRTQIPKGEVIDVIR